VRFHDFHLAGYSVSRFGAEIILHLVDDYPPRPKEESHIRFSDVAAYHFVHTGGAIMADIAEIPVAELLDQVWSKLSEWHRLHGGYLDWDDDRAKYHAALEGAGYRAWLLDSSVGFEGFVIARAAQGIPEDQPSKL
jgi:hypothetical protein